MHKSSTRLVLSLLVIVVLLSLAILLLWKAQPEREPAAPAPPGVVARIGDYTILQEELEERLRTSIRPRREEEWIDSEPVTAEATLRDMVAEKAMILEGRKLGYQDEETIHSSVGKFRRRQLTSALLEDYLRENQPPAPDDADIDSLVKANPKLTRERAAAMAQRATVTRSVEQLYQRLLEKSQVKKIRKSLVQAAKVHDRLLNQPAEPRKPNEYWIKNSQVRNELSEQEKNLVLATFEGGQFTLGDWFAALCDIVPPRRPTDLNTPEGVEKLLDRALRVPILVAEARARGYEENEALQERIREYEDQRVLWKVMAEQTEGVEQPNEEEVKAYFEANKEKFSVGPLLKLDQIWFRDRQTADKAKQALEAGADFEVVKMEHSLQKELRPYNTSPGSEGLFWDALWQADPNEIVGPLRGFYSDGVRWRIAKVLEKTPPKMQPYSEQLADRVKWAIVGQRRQEILDDYKKGLLAKYPHEILGDRIKDMNPLEIATRQEDE